MKVDTLIKNGQVVLETGIVGMDIGIRDGKIVMLADDESGIIANEIIDATDKL